MCFIERGVLVLRRKERGRNRLVMRGGLKRKKTSKDRRWDELQLIRRGSYVKIDVERRVHIRVSGTLGGALGPEG